MTLHYHDDWSNKSRPWVLDHDITFESKVNKGLKITAHAGRRTDFATVPRFGRWLISRNGPWNKETLLHDIRYQDQIGTRWQSDLDELLHLRCNPNVKLWEAYTIFIFSRLFGWYRWHQYKRQRKKNTHN